MPHFAGFTPETAELLWGIRMNNYRSWFDEHKAAYRQYVHEPMVLFGQEIFEKLCAEDDHFKDYPKVSRVTRDTRFTKNKDPYKDAKWVMFREDQSPGIEHFRPTYFFEISPERYRFGLGYWPPPKGMAAFRARVDENPEEALRLVLEMEQNGFFHLEGDTYKKVYGGFLPKPLPTWYNRRGLTLVREQPHDDLLFQRELVEDVARQFLSVYPLYLFFRSISDSVPTTQSSGS